MFDIKLEGIKRADSNWPWSPEIFIKPGIDDGYHIGLRVKEERWERNKAKVEAGVVVHEDKEWNFGTVRLSLAILPYEIIHTYYRDTGRGHQVAVKELVSKKGWANDSLGGMEIGYFGEGYEHKYATVWAQHLNS